MNFMCFFLKKYNQDNFVNKHQGTGTGRSQWLQNLKQQRNAKTFSLFNINSVTCQIYIFVHVQCNWLSHKNDFWNFCLLYLIIKMLL